MSEVAADARARLVAGTADMLGRRGLNAASVRELAKHAGAPLGSTYHYFPGGKYQLAAALFSNSSYALFAYLVVCNKLRFKNFSVLWRSRGSRCIGHRFQGGCLIQIGF